MIDPMAPGSFAAAYGLDLLVGDPQGMPHPVRLIGKAISEGERWLRRPAGPVQEVLSGAALTGMITGGAWLVARQTTRMGGVWGEALLAWTTLATRSLLDESSAVLDALDQDDIVLARSRLAMIVGRDTQGLDETEIARAVIETIAEGLCDGIVAPLFYLAIGGVPLALAYKAVNTLDSMIGHPEAPYRYFGRVPARLDDFANFIPARLAALAIVTGSFLMHGHPRDSWRVFLRDGDKHPSPNAGQPEAAMAGALGVQLGGMNYYDGNPSPKPLLGFEGRKATREDARDALKIAVVGSLVVFTAGWLWAMWRSHRS